MAGSHMMMMGAGSQIINYNIGLVGDSQIAPASASASVRMNADGSIAYTGNNSSGSTRWIQPGAPLLTYYVQILVTGDQPGSGPAVGSIVALTSDRTWVWTAPNSVTRTASCQMRIFADAGGVTLLFSDSFSVLVESII